jgi:hypothetical protein
MEQLATTHDRHWVDARVPATKKAAVFCGFFVFRPYVDQENT